MADTPARSAALAFWRDVLPIHLAADLFPSITTRPIDGDLDGRTFQQAETADRTPQFLQIVAKPDALHRKKRKQKQQSKLTRVPFEVSRLMEFCTLRELQNQTGHHVAEWPLVVLKELMDNALDACEEAEVAPVISITVQPGSIVIEDNATDGIEPSTIKSILDYNIRVSSREAYVSPTRGAQGNALKTILAMGYVLDRERQDNNAEAVGVTWSVDRLGRSLQDLVAFLSELHSLGIDLFLHQQGIDTTTPGGKAMFQMMGVFAEFERSIIQERVRAGLRRARSEGKRLGRPTIAPELEAKIRVALAKPNRPGVRKIAAQFGVDPSTVQRIFEASVVP